jgi:opacity protein-like surface antigen
MTRTKILLAGALLLAAAVAPVASAQTRGIEITPTVGYRFQSSISTDGSAVVDSIDVPDSLSYGLTAEFPVHPSLNVEFLWSHQDTDMNVDYRGTPPAGAKANLGGLKVDTIQIGGLWQSGRRGDKVRGYFDFLLGASIVNPPQNFDSLTRFSMSLGGGAKFNFSENVGLKAGIRWMPVYIGSSDTDYYYCDPYWGCWEMYDSHYLNQVDTSLGLIIRF